MKFEIGRMISISLEIVVINKVVEMVVVFKKVVEIKKAMLKINLV